MLVMASILVGIISALSAIVLKTFVHLMQQISEDLFKVSTHRTWYFLLPVVGILLTVMVVRIFFKGKLEKGLGSILFSIVRKSGRVEGNKMYSHIITSGITVGFGGSAGLEAPIVITGSAIGSNIATRLGFGEILIKPIATALTLGSGGNGGIFAPSLFTGAMAGFGLAFLVNTTGLSDLHINNFVAVGMAGIMAGVIHAPLTAIFLIAEITGGYVLFVPLMIVSALSYFISRYFEPYSIYTKKLAQKGHVFTGDKDTNVLRQILLDDLIETEFFPLLITDKFGKLIEAFTNSNRNIFPVVDADKNFIGVIQLDNVKELLFRPEINESLTIGDIVSRDILSIDAGENMEVVMSKLENSNLWNIPVTRNGKYLGFVSRSNVLSFYRRILKKTSSLF
jgi:predicted transcriptional regulator